MKKVEKKFSIFSEMGKELIDIARKYCNFQFDKKSYVTIGGVNYEFFASTENDEVIVSRLISHEKVKVEV